MDGENNGKPYFFNGWFGDTIIFGNTHIGFRELFLAHFYPPKKKHRYTPPENSHVGVPKKSPKMEFRKIESLPNKPAFGFTFVFLNVSLMLIGIYMKFPWFGKDVPKKQRDSPLLTARGIFFRVKLPAGFDRRIESLWNLWMSKE